MWLFVNYAMLILATLIAGAAAVATYWLLLHAALVLMRPAAIRTAPTQTSSPALWQRRDAKR
jgi:hypothetical protein